MSSVQSTETAIIAYLTTRIGETAEIRTIAHNIGLSLASVKITLTDMAMRGRIRGGSINGKVAYFLPTEQQLESERNARLRMPAWTPEMHISKTRSEIYARIAHERDAYPSIG